MAGETILVVDDEKQILTLSNRILISGGFEVKTAGSGEEALNLLDEEPVDLLLTDIRMSGMSGLELLTFFKKQWPNNAAVIFTGHGTIDMTLEAMRVGADGFVLKPFTKPELVDTINSAIEKMRLMRENIRLKSFMPLFKASRKMVEKIDKEELLEYVAQVAARETKADNTSIMIKDAEGAFRTAIQKGINGKEGKEHVRKFLESVAGRTTGSGQTVLLERDNPENDFNEEMQGNDIVSSLTVPMRITDELLGFINVANFSGNNSLSEKWVTDFMGILASQASAALKNAMLIGDMNELFISFIRSLSTAIDTKSPWTAGHSERVTEYALLIGRELGLAAKDMKTLELAGLLHDIGKIGTPEAILNKAGRLTAEEFRMMKTHPAAGAKIISHVGQLNDIIPPVRHHHERYDGCGYPDGLKGKRIPLLARILSVADTYDAMKADRPYRTGRPMNFIVKELEDNRGKQFDPEPVDALLKEIGSGISSRPKAVDGRVRKAGTFRNDL